MRRQTPEPDRNPLTVARLLIERNPPSWLRLIELVHVSEILAVARALVSLMLVSCSGPPFSGSADLPSDRPIAPSSSGSTRPAAGGSAESPNRDAAPDAAGSGGAPEAGPVEGGSGGAPGAGGLEAGSGGATGGSPEVGTGGAPAAPCEPWPGNAALCASGGWPVSLHCPSSHPPDCIEPAIGFFCCPR